MSNFETENQITKLSQQPIVDQMSRQIGVDGMMLLHTIKTMLPRDSSFATLMTCVSVASDLGLNPMTKQIYYMPTKGGAIQPIVSVDGWIAIANRHDDFDGWGEFVPKFADDNKTLFSMTGTMHHKTREKPTVITEYFDECSKGGGPVWKSHPMRMMRNRVINQLTRVALGISGVMDPDEFSQWQQIEGEPVDITPPDPRGGDQIDMRGEKRKRPASGAFKDTGGAERFNALSSELDGAATVEELKACYDAFCIDGTAWAAFPAGWARLLQETYYYRKVALENVLVPDDVPDEPLADQAGFLASLKEQVETCPKEHLSEVVEANADLVARLTPANRLAVAELYADWMS
jgi:hypothetical protein